MADFKTAYALTMGNEFGYANNPNDRGGETINGIARNSHAKWGGWALVDAAKKAPGFPGSLQKNELLLKLISAFYKEQFWNKLNLDKVQEQLIANELFDTGVNCGTGVAALFLQRVLNVLNRNGKDYPDLLLDGAVGGQTISILNSHKNPKRVLKLLNVLQGSKYIGICEANPKQEEFMNGWANRVFESSLN